MTTRFPTEPAFTIATGRSDADGVSGRRDTERGIRRLTPSSRPMEQGLERGAGRPSTVRRRLLARAKVTAPPEAPSDLFDVAPRPPGASSASAPLRPDFCRAQREPTLGRWRPLSPDGQVLTLEQKSDERTERVLAVALKGSGFVVVHARPWMTGEDYECLRSLGSAQFVLSLTGRDHEGVRDFTRRNPKVVVVAAGAAAPILRDKITAPVHDLSRLTPFLEAGVSLLVPSGLGKREAWLQVATAYGKAWITGVAFQHIERMPSGVRGFVSGLMGVKPGLGIAPGFKRKVLDDLGSYRSWLFRTLREERPSVLIPPEGRTIEDPSLATRLRGLVQSLS